ncbi:MAG TPA: hypothetical protein VGE77_00635, partial [Nocardioides sp.]
MAAWSGARSTTRASIVLAAMSLAATCLVAGASGAGATSSGAAWPGGHRVFVSPDGHPGAAGTREDPLASVRDAVAVLDGPGTVLLRGGTYAQRIVLRHADGVTVRPFRGERVILDGGTLTPPAGRSAMVTIVDSSHVAVRGLDIRGYRTTSTQAMPIGIYVHGASSHVSLAGN